MLKKIPVSDARLGMYLHKLEGAWIDHPFWKSRFVLDDAADLRALRASGIKDCWIDVSKGLDVAQGTPAQPAPAGGPAPATVAGLAEAALSVQVSFEEEVHRAAAVCKRSRTQVMAMFGEARLGKAVDAQDCLPLVNEISESVFRNPGALVSLARLKTQDDYTYMHSVAVCALMVALSRQLGFDDDRCREAGLAGLVHDLGKALMPLEVLNKPGKLTDAEFAIMKTHPERGHELLLEGRGIGAVPLEVCLHHHEKMDGSGYPHRLDGDRIDPMSRMGAVCDVYDAITSDRPYKAGWDPAESISRMASWSGHFDQGVFRAFVKSLGIYPTGSLVRMESGRLAVVVEQNPHMLLAPVIKVFFSTRSGAHIPPQRIDLSAPGCNERITGRESPEKWNFPALDELWAGEEALKKRR